MHPHRDSDKAAPSHDDERDHVRFAACLPATRHADSMSIVDSEYTFPRRVVERQCIRNSMRPRAIGRYALRNDLDPEPTANLDQQPVEVEQAFKTGIVGHCQKISHNDNI